MSAKRFELIWPIAGSTASKAEMQSIGLNPIAKGKVVKLPILPGIRAYTKERTMVEYRGFAKDASNGLLPDYIVEALVLH